MSDETISHYRLVRSLGKGTFGEVFEGVHQHDEHIRVAVKVLHAGLAADADFVASLRAECRVLTRLKHAHIVGFRELVVRAGAPPAMVLDLATGGSLEELAAKGPVRAAEVVRYLREALSALAYAHEEGVIHRDIKPGNLLLDGRGRVQVVDFGIAKAADSGRSTRTGTALGTVAYMAPELFDGAPASAQSDLYALGLVGWELLVGRVACSSPTLMGAMKWHETVGPPALGGLVPGLPPGLAEVVSSLTAREASARPASALTALSALDGVGRGGGGRPAMPGTVQVPVGGRSGGPAVETPAARPAPAPGAPKASPTAPGTVMVQTAPRPQVAPPARPAEGPAEEDDAPQARSSSGPLVGALVAGALLVGLIGVVAMQGSSEDGAAESAGPAAPSPEEAVEPAPPVRPSYQLRLVPAGTYTIGCTKGQAGECDDAERSHKVKLTRSILMGETEVTQGLYAAVMGTNPSEFQSCGPSCPVENISWYDAVAFANALSSQEGLEPCYVISGENVSWPSGPACLGYRLPTESEWEVAARGGIDAKYSGGDALDAVGWYDANSGDKTHPAGQKQANGYGLYDMSGNVWEWTWDWGGKYPSGTPADPAGPASGSNRVDRGGSWNSIPQSARVADRGRLPPFARNGNIGVRLLRTAP